MADIEVEDLRGTPREIGRQHGEGSRQLIRRHLEINARRASLATGARRERALAYQPHVRAAAPWLDQELIGVAEGAGIDIADAYALQLRSELDRSKSVVAAGRLGECTTFATIEDGEPIAGQNLDLPDEYRELLTVRRIHDAQRPALVMMAPAGQISQLGMNEHGLAVFASFLPAGGWRVGFPRYLLSRLVLACTDVAAATRSVTRVHRASSRSLLVADGTGRARVIELTPTRHALIENAGLPLVQTNHVVSPELADDDRSDGEWAADSRARHDRMRLLLAAGVPAHTAAADRDGAWPLSRDLSDGDPDFVTVGSAVARLASRRFEVATGAPHTTPYSSLKVAA